MTSAPARHDSAPASPASSAVSRREPNEMSDDAVVAAQSSAGRDFVPRRALRVPRAAPSAGSARVRPGPEAGRDVRAGGSERRWQEHGGRVALALRPRRPARFSWTAAISRRADVSWLRANIGTVSQDVTLFDGTMRAETITYASDASDRESRIARADVVAAADVANAMGFIEAFRTVRNARRRTALCFPAGRSRGSPSRASFCRTPPSYFWTKPRARWTPRASSESALSRAAEGRTVILVAHRRRHRAPRGPRRRAQRRAAGGVRDARAAHEEDERRVQGARGDATRGDVTKRRTCALRFPRKASRKVDRVFDEAEFLFVTVRRYST